MWKFVWNWFRKTSYCSTEMVHVSVNYFDNLCCGDSMNKIRLTEDNLYVPVSHTYSLKSYIFCKVIRALSEDLRIEQFVNVMTVCMS